jgi:predicted phosphodiesterase
MEVATRIFIISGTHGEMCPLYKNQRAHVAIHCGDLTEEPKIAEFRSAIQLLRSLDAPLKLVIAGNHDFTLDTPAFQEKITAVVQPLEPELVQRGYGDYGEARRLLQEANDSSIIFLVEGQPEFVLENGALIKVYASPFTPSKGGWGFQYTPEKGHDFSIPESVEIVVSYGPPHGIMDYTADRIRAGCPDLFDAVARARPRLHCFGQIHEGWWPVERGQAKSPPISPTLIMAVRR